jgi:sulfatase modifying factor 1
MVSVVKACVLVGWLASAACGRIGFASLASSDATGGDGGVSCAGLQPTCGPAGAAPCCDSLLVPGGTFYRSYDVATDNQFPDMTNPATVSDFRLDTYEVTVGRYRQFFDAGLGTQANPPAAGAGARSLNGMADQGGWDPAWNANLPADSAALDAALNCDGMQGSWTTTPGANESLPINCMSWYDAVAFCAWDGGFVPTEAEWNYVASGGNQQRAYPWSSPPSSMTDDCSYANQNTGTAFCVNPPKGFVNRVGSESPKGDGRWGHADLGGNLLEWTLDWYNQSYVNPCVDCADMTMNASRTLRGGFWFGVPYEMRTALRGGDDPKIRGSGGGMRCARAP